MWYVISLHFSRRSTIQTFLTPYSTVLIIIIIVIVVLIYKFVIQGNGSNNNKAAKRFVLDNILSERGLPGTSFHETFVRPGVPWNGGSGSKMVRAVRERRFVA
jgi:hypothetical protein